jgi:hypothetical protein
MVYRYDNIFGYYDVYGTDRYAGFPSISRLGFPSRSFATTVRRILGRRCSTWTPSRSGTATNWFDLRPFTGEGRGGPPIRSWSKPKTGGPTTRLGPSHLPRTISAKGARRDCRGLVQRSQRCRQPRVQPRPTAARTP